MLVYFLSSDPHAPGVSAIERKVRSVVPELNTIESLDQIAQRILSASTEKIIVIFVAPSLEPASIDNLIAIAARHNERVFFILVSDEISASDYKRLIRTGGADWVSPNGTAQEITDIVSKYVTASARSAESTGRPAVVSFVPSAGGVGNTTIVLEVGVHLKTQKATRSRNICCVDLDFQNSHICDYLDIEARLQIQDISDHPKRLDAHLFNIFISRHSSGLDVIAAPRSKLDVCDIAVGALDALFQMIAHHYDLVLVDLPVSWFSWTTPVIANSDAAVISGTNSIPCLRQIAETLEAVQGAKRKNAEIAIAINRCQRGSLGGIARQRHVETVLGDQKLFYIAEDPAALECVNTGRPMALSPTNRKIKSQFEALARFCAALKNPTAIQGPPRQGTA